MRFSTKSFSSLGFCSAFSRWPKSGGLISPSDGHVSVGMALNSLLAAALKLYSSLCIARRIARYKSGTRHF
jgi:hypothetical protein